ncbi:response regulator transcription factor [Fodinisporobacter ferrooxydans]|uniref:Response regulator transcription factor n=1 Tax=Fodinisporobacter ferrooxydans TaxID=2901836 RepID=A0ABY4CPA9_9BACL|nr:response regulator transcription factor [Alicyclobacillaceae bacterium MYW30-H2]
MQKKITVMLVDDHEMVRMGLRSLLTMYSQIEIIAEAGNAAQCMTLAVQMKPDVILLDIRLPDKSGVEVCRMLKQQIPASRIIMLTSYDDEKFIREAFLHGANGYILKEIRGQNLIKSIESVYEGKTMLDPKIADKAFHKIKESKREETLYNCLTAIEKQILFHISEGLKNREIAEKLGLKEKTVRNYVSQILEKLDLHKRAEAATFAVRYQRDHLSFPG